MERTWEIWKWTKTGTKVFHVTTHEESWEEACDHAWEQARFRHGEVMKVFCPADFVQAA